MWIMMWTETDSIVDRGVDSAVGNLSVHVTGYRLSDLTSDAARP